jgi:hypothetical protein
MIRKLINKVFSIVSQKSTNKSSVLDMVIIKEVDMKNSENIPIYDDIDSRNIALIYKKIHLTKR